MYLLPHNAAKLEGRGSVKQMFSKQNVYSPKNQGREGMAYYHYLSKLPSSRSLLQILSRLIWNYTKFQFSGKGCYLFV